MCATQLNFTFRKRKMSAVLWCVVLSSHSCGMDFGGKNAHYDENNLAISRARFAMNGKNSLCFFHNFSYCKMIPTSDFPLAMCERVEFRVLFFVSLSREIFHSVNLFWIVSGFCCCGFVSEACLKIIRSNPNITREMK